MAELSKLTMDELQKAARSGAISFDQYNAEVIHRAAPTNNRKAKEFSIALSDSGGYNFQGFDVGVNVWIPPGLMDAIVGDKAKEIAIFVTANRVKSHDLRKVRKASDDYKKSCGERRDAFAASKATT